MLKLLLKKHIYEMVLITFVLHKNRKFYYLSDSEFLKNKFAAEVS